MGRGSLALIVCVAATLALAQSAWAASITVTAAPGGDSIAVQASGTADSCATYGCDSQAVAIEISSDDQYSNSCSTPLSPQSSTPIPASGGPFSVSATIPAAPGQSYTICGYLTDTIGGLPGQTAASSPVRVTLAPASCPAGTAHLLRLSTPATVAVGRRVSILVESNNDGQPIASGSVTARRTAAGSVLYSHSFSAGELNAFNTGAPQRAYAFTLPPGTAPVPITLAYQQAETPLDPTSAQCIDQRTATILPVTGALPSVRLLNSPQDNLGGAEAVFSTPGGCLQTRAVPVAFTLQADRRALTLSTSDECAPGSWRVHGQAPGVATGRHTGAAGTRITLDAAGQVNASYRLTVRIAGRITKRAKLSVFYEHLPSYRVYEGTDQFINYCIDQSRPVYSYHLRLFCWLPGQTFQSLKLTSR